MTLMVNFFADVKMSCLILATRTFHTYYHINAFENLVSSYFIKYIPNKLNNSPKLT